MRVAPLLSLFNPGNPVNLSPLLRLLGCRRFREAERVSDAARDPRGADQQVHRILEECRLITLNQVAYELENPADDEQRERPPPVKEEDREAQDNHRDADAVRQPVQRMLMLLLVTLHERCRHKVSFE